MTFDPQNLNIAAALIWLGHEKVALTWNKKWVAFVFPMTKIDAGPRAESSQQAALQAAAEVLHLPVRVVAGQAAKAMRTLQLCDRWRSACKSDPLREKDGRVNRTHRIRQ